MFLLDQALNHSAIHPNESSTSFHPYTLTALAFHYMPALGILQHTLTQHTNTQGTQISSQIHHNWWA